MLTLLALIWGASFMLIKIADRRAHAGDADPRPARLGRAAARRDRDGAPRPARDVRRDPPQVAVARRDRAREHGGAVLAPRPGERRGSTPGWRRSSRERSRSSTRCSRSRSSASRGSGACGSSASGSASSGSRCSSARSRRGSCSPPSPSSAMALCYAIGTLLAGPLPPRHAAARRRARVDRRLDDRRTARRRRSRRRRRSGTAETIAAILVLGFVGTAIAYLLFFALIQRAGANYATLVTYLVPPIALAYGAIFLGESFGATGVRRRSRSSSSASRSRPGLGSVGLAARAARRRVHEAA